MKKTIKKNVHMRLDELIKYVWENDGSLFKKHKAIMFYTKDSKSVTFDDTGHYESNNWFDPEDLLIVEEEEEITEDTVFELLIELFFDGEEYYSLEFTNKSIGYVKNKETTSIYGLIDGKLQLIWEREEEC